MANGNGVRDEIKEQQKKLKDMSFPQKIKYIWGYYKFAFLGAIIFISLGAALVISILRNNYDTVCYITVIDGNIENAATDKDVLSVGFTKYLGIDGKKKQIDLDYNYSLIERDMDQDAYVSYDKIYTLASTHSMDGYLSELDYIDFFSSDKELFLCDLRDLLSDDELDYLKDYIVYYKTNNGTKVPIAVNITEAPVIKESNLSMKHPCYGVVVTSKHYDEATNFIRYVFNMEKK